MMSEEGSFVKYYLRVWDLLEISEADHNVFN
jgi:hypothetical protein